MQSPIFILILWCCGVWGKNTDDAYRRWQSVYTPKLVDGIHGAMRAVLESVGVTDVLAKSKGSSNPHNLVKATILALGEMRDARMVAQNRGVSMEKVFRG